jgi:hypothetical protein
MMDTYFALTWLDAFKRAVRYKNAYLMRVACESELSIALVSGVCNNSHFPLFFFHQASYAVSLTLS